MIRTRFAPSPTGPLHLGHAYAAKVAFDLAQQNDGAFLVRIEDIDPTRRKPEWEAQIFDDLNWLGLPTTAPILYQSKNMAAYNPALAKLWDMGLLYECHCNRRDITQALSAPQDQTIHGPDGVIYPGTCRDKANPMGIPQNGHLRINIRKAMEHFDTVEFMEVSQGYNQLQIASADWMIQNVGDFIVRRAAFGTSYHLAVVVDDAAQQITHVTRGHDLFTASFLHVVLQKLLGLPTPLYFHHDLVTDADGKRLAKRDDAKAIALYRDQGLTPAQVLDLARPS